MTPGRVALAGLGAGVVNVILGVGFASAYGAELMLAALREHGLRVIDRPEDALPHLVVRLLFGLGVTALYAALARGLGPGPRTALVAAFFAWGFGYGFKAWGDAHIGLFPVALAWTIAVWGLVEMSLTALAGAWLASRMR